MSQTHYSQANLDFADDYNGQHDYLQEYYQYSLQQCSQQQQSQLHQYSVAESLASIEVEAQLPKVEQKIKKGRPKKTEMMIENKKENQSLNEAEIKMENAEQQFYSNQQENHWSDDILSQEMVGVIMEAGKYQYAVITGKKASQRNNKMDERTKELLSSKKTELTKKIGNFLKYLNYSSAKKGSEKEYFFVRQKRATDLIKQNSDGNIVSNIPPFQLDNKNYEQEYSRLIKMLNSVFPLCEPQFCENLVELINIFVKEKKLNSSADKILQEWINLVNNNKERFKEFYHCQFIIEATKKEREELEMIENNPSNYQQQQQKLNRNAQKQADKQKQQEPKRQESGSKDSQLDELCENIQKSNKIIKEIFNKFMAIFERALMPEL